MTLTRGSIILIIIGFFQGNALLAFIASGPIGLVFLTVAFVLFVIALILKLIDKADNLYQIGGIIAGVLVALLVPALSLAALAGISPALMFLALLGLIFLL